MRTNKTISGQTLIEFSFLLPLLFILLMGLFDVGRAVFYFAIINTAVREGSRYAIVQPRCDYLSNPGDCDGDYLDSYPLDCSYAQSVANINICNAVRDKLFTVTDLSNYSVMIDHVVYGTDEPVVITLDIDVLFEPITPGLGIMGDLQMHANSQMIMSPIAEP